MRKVVLFIAVLVAVKLGKAQTFDEWFKQNKTQKKYLIQQIAAFQLYTEYIEKGYSIVNQGLTTIGKIKKGDFNLHSDFFGSLKAVNPAIRTYSKVADIISFQVKIIQTYKAGHKQVQAVCLFSPGEIHYINNVFTNLITHSTNDIDELIKVITASDLEMKDDERIERVDAIYVNIQDRYSFAKSFVEEAKALELARRKEKVNIETSRRLHGIKS